MGDKTGIEWSEATWNPVTGCTKVSPGCANCYAETLTQRFGKAWGVSTKPWTPANAAEVVQLRPDRLEQPLRWTRPRLIFVNSMSDLFHEDVPERFIARVFAVMQLASHHTFQVLTKRPGAAADMLRDREFLALVDDARETIRPRCGDFAWPLPNVWLGTSIENRRFVARADLLRETPAAVRFISAEPLLGRLVYDHPEGKWLWADNGLGRWTEPPMPDLDLSGIDWLIVGGESGPRARPMREDWASGLIDAALATRCPSCAGHPVLRCTACGNVDAYPGHGPGPALCTGGCTRSLGDGRERTLHVDEPCWRCLGDGRHTRVFVKQLGGRGDKRGGARAVIDGRTWTEMPILAPTRGRIAA